MSAIVADIAERTKMEQEQAPSHTAGAGAVVVGVAGSGDNTPNEAVEEAGGGAGVHRLCD